MAPGYIHYGPGFVDCKPVVRPAGSDAKKDGFGLRAINTETGRKWITVSGLRCRNHVMLIV